MNRLIFSQIIFNEKNFLKFIMAIMLFLLPVLADIFLSVVLAQMVTLSLFMVFITGSSLLSIYLGWFLIRYRIKRTRVGKLNIFNLESLLGSYIALIYLFIPGLLTFLLGIIFLLPFLSKILGQLILKVFPSNLEVLHSDLNIYSRLN